MLNLDCSCLNLSLEFFPEIFGIFFVALMNYLAISRLFFSQKYFLKIKKNHFLLSTRPSLLACYCFRPKVRKSGSAPWTPLFHKLCSSPPNILAQTRPTPCPLPAVADKRATLVIIHLLSCPSWTRESRPAPPGLCLGVRDTTKPRPCPYKMRRPSRVS
jgi:hypothetical protein